MKKLFFVVGLISTSAFSADWESKTVIDKMTDKASIDAFVVSSNGDKFTIVRRQDDTIWGYIQLAGVNQFSVNEKLLMRVDKNTPVELSDELDILSKQLGRPMKTWEWNPSLIGFRLSHGKLNSGCGVLKQLFDGKQLILRYHPNQSTTRDIEFTLSGNQKVISDAVGFDLSNCPASVEKSL